MANLYIITGPSGVGKSTISKKLAENSNKSVLIEGDEIYHLVCGGYESAWKEKNHLEIFWKNVIRLINNFLEDGYDVIFNYIVNPENVSMKFLGNSIQLLGAIPIPNNKNGMKNFINAIETHINQKHSITIYPEAHIWPYYTKIRPFKAVSFKNNDKIQIVTYIDGPFFANSSLTAQEQKQDLRDKVYNCMTNRSKNSNIEYIKYIKT